MIKFTFTLQDELGIHARPAGALVKEASKYASAVTITRDTKTADAKRLFSVMSLGAKCGDVLEVSVMGEDEKTAAEAFEKFLKETL